MVSYKNPIANFPSGYLTSSSNVITVHLFFSDTGSFKTISLKIFEAALSLKTQMGFNPE